jgi:energy-coupling factor transporter ATP-binding protein EcfA2
MRINSLRLTNFCGFEDVFVSFDDFSCLIGSNGIGKTTVLNAISLLCSSLDFKDDVGPEIATEEEWVPKVTGQERLASYLRKNIRIGSDSFQLEGTFFHGGMEHVVQLGPGGFRRNDVVGQDWWWPGIAFFAKFDAEMTNFQLRKALWPQFAAHYEGITGFPVEPQFYTETDLVGLGYDGEMAINFTIDKGKRGKIPCRLASAGEKKIAKTLSQIVSLERPPHIALVDNLEAHVHHGRHLRMFEELKAMFSGIQVVSTTHSTVVIGKYEPNNDLIDLDRIFEEGKRCENTPK